MAEAPARLSALSVLVFGGSMTAGQLAAAEQVRPPTMSRVVAGLERDRLIKRVPDVTDARRVHLQATPKGAMLMNRGRRRRIKHLAKRLESLTQNDLAILEKSLGLLARILHDWK